MPSASVATRLPSPCRPAIISLPRIERKAMMQPMRRPVTITGRAADEVAYRQSKRTGDGEGGDQLGERDTQVVVKPAGLDDLPELFDDPRQVRQEHRADLANCADEIPKRDDGHDEASLDSARVPV